MTQNTQEAVTVGVGAAVPNFVMDTYDPQAGAFGKVSLEGLIKEKKWTVLVFYPAISLSVDGAGTTTHMTNSGKWARAYLVARTMYTHLAWKARLLRMSGIPWPRTRRKSIGVRRI